MTYPSPRAQLLPHSRYRRTASSGVISEFIAQPAGTAAAIGHRYHRCNVDLLRIPKSGEQGVLAAAATDGDQFLMEEFLDEFQCSSVS